MTWTEHVVDHGASSVDPPWTPLASSGGPPCGPTWAEIGPSAVDRLDRAARAGTARDGTVRDRTDRRMLGLKRHALLAFVTFGVWLLVIPGLLLWRRGACGAARVWASGAVVAVLIGTLTLVAPTSTTADAGQPAAVTPAPTTTLTTTPAPSAP